jgi:hypothetical protein
VWPLVLKVKVFKASKVLPRRDHVTLAKRALLLRIVLSNLQQEAGNLRQRRTLTALNSDGYIRRLYTTAVYDGRMQQRLYVYI